MQWKPFFIGVTTLVNYYCCWLPTKHVSDASECSHNSFFPPVFTAGLNITSFQQTFSVSPGTWILWQKHLVPPKLPNYHPMQNAWSMDFISGFFTHVSQLEFTLLASHPVDCWGRGGGDNEGACPSTTSRRSSGPNVGRQGCTWRPCQGVSTVFCDHAEGDRHWLCAVWHRIWAETKGQGQMAW